MVPEVGRPPTAEIRGVSRASAETPSRLRETSQASAPDYSDAASNVLCQRVAEIQNNVAPLCATSSAPAPISEPDPKSAPTEQSSATGNAVDPSPARAKFPEPRRVIGD